MKNKLDLSLAILFGIVFTVIIHFLFFSKYKLIFPSYFVWTLVFIFSIKILKINLSLEKIFIYFLVFALFFSFYNVIIVFQNNLICSKDFFIKENYFCKNWFYLR